MTVSNDTYLPWLILNEIPGIGPLSVKRLIQQFGSPEQILKSAKFDLLSTRIVNQKGAQAIIEHEKYQARALKELSLFRQKKTTLIGLTDTEYPPLLSKINDPPPFISLFGNIDPQSPCIAMVGSRKATSYGMSSARKLAFDLATKGFTIVSGLASGIDTAAHQGALDAKGKTIAVLGSGLGQIYPRQNQGLFSAIRKNGAIFSEFYYYARPQAHHFPIRNRVIAGLSVGTIVVEAARKSGSLITARLAAEYGREVFAVPGSIKSTTSAGTHFILKQGATLVENAQDIIDELGQFIHPVSAEKEKQVDKLVNHEQVSVNSSVSGLTPFQRAVFNILDPYPMHIDSIAQTSKLDTGDVSAALLELELKGLVARSQGNYYQISEENIG